jgi:hypothetical protein
VGAVLDKLPLLHSLFWLEPSPVGRQETKATLQPPKRLVSPLSHPPQMQRKGQILDSHRFGKERERSQRYSCCHFHLDIG